MGKRISMLILVHCVIVMLLTGCWDELDIEERGFVVGTALDLVDEEETGGTYTVSLTDQFVVPAGIGNPGQGSGDAQAYINITETGESMSAITSNIATMSSRYPFYGHLKILALSEELVQKPDFMASIMDKFIRNTEMRRGIKVVISDGKAKDILDTKSGPEKLPAKYLDMLLENNHKRIETIDAVRIGRVHGYLLNNNSYVLPGVSAADDKVQSNGAAVFHGFNNKMIGHLNEKETKGYNLAKQNNKGGSIKFMMGDQLMVFEIDTSKRDMKVDTKNPENMDVSITIKAEGIIQEMFGSKSLLKPEYLDKIERKVAAKMEELVEATIKKSQKELNADIFGVYQLLQQKHFEVYEKIKNDWELGDNNFANANIHVSADATVRATGTTDRAKNKGTSK